MHELWHGQACRAYKLPLIKVLVERPCVATGYNAYINESNKWLRSPLRSKLISPSYIMACLRLLEIQPSRQSEIPQSRSYVGRNVIVRTMGHAIYLQYAGRTQKPIPWHTLLLFLSDPIFPARLPAAAGYFSLAGALSFRNGWRPPHLCCVLPVHC